MSEDIATFVKARIDEYENTARYVGPALVAWLTFRDGDGQLLYTTVAAASGEVTDVWVADGHELPEPASSRVVYDPARAIAKAEGMRAIVHRYEAQSAMASRNAMEEDRAWTLWLPVAYLAAIWSDHPDYREEWKP